jgi:hypothetical protein
LSKFLKKQKIPPFDVDFDRTRANLKDARKNWAKRKRKNKKDGKIDKPFLG